MKDLHVKGSIYGVSSFLIWGFVPFFWKLVLEVPSLELLLHRVFWGVLSLIAVFMLSTKRRSNLFSFLESIKDMKSIVMVLLCSFLIGINWLTYVYAVNSNHIIEASFGYFANPVLNVILGYFFFEEVINGRKPITVALATTAVGLLFFFWDLQALWISFVLLGTFGAYGALKKYLKFDSLSSLFLEICIVCFFLGTWYLFSSNDLIFFQTTATKKSILLMAGPITIIPLLLFNLGVRYAKLSTIGMLQYIAPSFQFLVAFLYFNEEVSLQKLIPFSLIWVAILIFLWEDRKRNE
ncbi:MAG: EamA family transporter RarD [Oligoflexia bacterium]|nr:EamA family transporter RarD [Oligoflexia bacterium]